MPVYLGFKQFQIIGVYHPIPGSDVNRRQFVQRVTDNVGPAFIYPHFTGLHIPFPGANVCAPDDICEALPFGLQLHVGFLFLTLAMQVVAQHPANGDSKHGIHHHDRKRDGRQHGCCNSVRQRQHQHQHDNMHQQSHQIELIQADGFDVCFEQCAECKSDQAGCQYNCDANQRSVATDEQAESPDNSHGNNGWHGAQEQTADG